MLQNIVIQLVVNAEAGRILAFGTFFDIDGQRKTPLQNRVLVADNQHIVEPDSFERNIQ